MYQKSLSYAILFLRYVVWQMQLLFFILGYFLPFFAFTFKSSKKQNFKKMKKQTKIKNKIKQQQQQQPGDIVLHKCMKNHDHMLYCSWDIWYMTDGIFHSRLFFALLPPPPSLTALKKKISKKEPWRYHDHMLYCSWDIWCVTDVTVIFHFGLFCFLSPP